MFNCEMNGSGMIWPIFVLEVFPIFKICVNQAEYVLNTFSCTYLEFSGGKCIENASD